MRLGVIANRLVLVDGDTAVDIEQSSNGRFPADPERLFDTWDNLVDWAATAEFDGERLPLEQLQNPVPAPGQVFGIGTVADPCIDEGVHELQLVEGDVCRARRGRKLDHFAGVFIWRAWIIWATRVPGHGTGTKSRLNSVLSVTRPGYWSAGLSQRSYARRQPGRPARRQTR